MEPDGEDPIGCHSRQQTRRVECEMGFGRKDDEIDAIATWRDGKGEVGGERSDLSRVSIEKTDGFFVDDESGAGNGRLGDLDGGIGVDDRCIAEEGDLGIEAGGFVETWEGEGKGGFWR